MKQNRAPNRRPHLSIKPSAAEPDPPPARTTTSAPPASASGSKPAPTRRYSEKHRRFAQLVVERGTSDLASIAKDAGFEETHRAAKIYRSLRDLIEFERLRIAMGQQMEVDEALRELAKVARQDDDLKTKHSAVRTVLEVHGALSAGKLPPGERSGIERQIEEMVGRLKQKLDSSGAGAGNRVLVRAGVEISVDSGVGAASTTPKTAIPEPEILVLEGVKQVENAVE